MTTPENPGADTVYGKRSWTDWLQRGTDTTPDFAVGTDDANPMNDLRVEANRILATLLETPPSYIEPMLFRPRFGYSRETTRIEDVLGVSGEDWRIPNDANPGTPAGIESGGRNVLNNDLGRV